MVWRNSWKKITEQINTINPPHKGGDFKVELINFLWAENDVLSMSKLFFLKIYKIIVDIIVLKKKTRKKFFSNIINIFFL